MQKWPMEILSLTVPQGRSPVWPLLIKVMGRAILIIIIIIIKIIIMHIFGRIKFRYSTLDTVS